MGIIRNHLNQMKVEQPKEYRRLMQNYQNENEFVRDVLGLSIRAMNAYVFQKGDHKYDKRRFNK